MNGREQQHSDSQTAWLPQKTILYNTVSDDHPGYSSKLSGRDQVDVILLNFAKAFDKVPHQRLLYKLNYYGVRGPTIQWVQSFLSQRTQQVLLDGSCSSQADVISGVPQGTVLAPYYFWPLSTTCLMLSSTPIPPFCR